MSGTLSERNRMTPERQARPSLHTEQVAQENRSRGEEDKRQNGQLFVSSPAARARSQNAPIVHLFSGAEPPTVRHRPQESAR